MHAEASANSAGGDSHELARRLRLPTKSVKLPNFKGDHKPYLAAQPNQKRSRPNSGTRSRAYALVFIEPDELDVNFAWSWLKIACGLDDDPFVDVRTGFQ